MSGAPDPEAPGPPPLPPADLHARPLPLHVCRAGTELYRVHRSVRDPLFFGPSQGAAPAGRWETESFGVCYFGEASFVAFAETLLRAAGESAVEASDLQTRSMATVRVLRDLRLVALHGPGLARVGATAAVCMGPYSVTREWSRALHAHPDEPDGIRYRARHDDDGFAVALFDRARDGVRVRGTQGLLEPDSEAQLAEWLDRYGIGLM